MVRCSQVEMITSYSEAIFDAFEFRLVLLVRKRVSYNLRMVSQRVRTMMDSLDRRWRMTGISRKDSMVQNWRCW